MSKLTKKANCYGQIDGPTLIIENHIKDRNENDYTVTLLLKLLQESSCQI